MKNQIDHFLLGLLWLLAITLGASFLFNIKFGFNIFSAAHWQYLGQIQASGAYINNMFYLFIIITVIVMITGLYFLIRPRYRKIIMDPEHFIKKDIQIAEIPNPNPIIQTVTESVNIGNTSRPPRLNLGNSNNYVSAPISPIISEPVILNDNSKELSEIFQSAGYTVKQPPKINNVKPVLFAVGNDEVVWIGCENVNITDFKTALNKIESIFVDTLEDIKITINAFILGDQESFDEIKTYKTIDELKQNLPKNRDMSDQEREDFEAYSEYIDTVADYLNKQ